MELTMIEIVGSACRIKQEQLIYVAATGAEVVI